VLVLALVQVPVPALVLVLVLVLVLSTSSLRGLRPAAAAPPGIGLKCRRPCEQMES
jgi:hypothetical protein